MSAGLMAFSNLPSYKKSNEKFNFSISRELLLNPNDVLVGEMIGEGGYSIFYKGLLRNRFPVAVKIMQPSDKKKFQIEVLLPSKMRDANIMKFVGACIEPQLVIVTEVMEVDTLQRIMWSSQPKPLDLYGIILECCWAHDSDARPETKEIRLLLTILLRVSTSDVSIDEDSVKKPKEKKKKKKVLVKMMRPFVKMFRACYKA
ncbi:PREDICTED: probable LRR receptor-like serine/threonine-protein kinase At1g53440 [Camelina sativa]|uniref:Probable LRR receptor-like serine/threonine-protein kinase At1g53440 n=1 Tax=Camelina sativa TaxID=90675 RepID=A0ABM0ZGK3_CAMSA|nr:PREDICTED: probable LRR receptor-like serine/threonine-protein kinase At1g53440 [Camelina sativa]